MSEPSGVEPAPVVPPVPPTKKEFEPNSEIDLDDALGKSNMDWGFAPPPGDVPFAVVYIYNKQEDTDEEDEGESAPPAPPTAPEDAKHDEDEYICGMCEENLHPDLNMGACAAGCQMVMCQECGTWDEKKQEWLCDQCVKSPASESGK
jgi:hypothetical protein